MEWTEEFWAHTPSKGSNGKPHDLRRHLLDTAARAKGYAEAFGAGNLAYMLGLWHDLGKYNPDFQQYLRDAKQAEEEGKELGRKGPPHAIWGAAHLQNLLSQHPQRSTFILPVLGHHAGLEDDSEGEQKILSESERGRWLKTIAEAIPTFGLQVPSPPEQVPSDAFRQEFFTRMVTSALVDADFLDTERHFGQERPEAREQPLTVEQLWSRFGGGRERLLEKQMREGKVPAPHVRQVRDEVYEECLKTASGKPGLYRLTVPTGGGKTLSGLAFALKHATENGLRRVVVAIPYTSIIDQNAKVYRDVLGADAVLEHHSAIQPPDNKQERQDLATLRLQLATENWDVPLICTTFVQLFESLLARKTSKIRKLHRLARSVIVLDEVQTLPPDLRAPTLDVLRTLVDDYGVSVVLCTATQPAFEMDAYTDSFKGIEQTQIVPQYAEHFQQLKRVDYDKHPNYPEAVLWPDLAAELKERPQVLTILNTRRDALALIRAMQEAEVSNIRHLSTLMCGAHRRKVLAEVEERLDKGQDIRLISTQVVEAGVDLDFPVVYRALAPLDRIIQAAGRCNRNGKDTGQVIIFQTESGKAPKGPYQKGIEKARRLVETRDIAEELNGTDILRDYFELLYRDVEPDEKGVQSLRGQLEFRQVADTYRLIDNDTVSVIVPYGDYAGHLRKWQEFPTRRGWRALQPYIVNIYSHEAKKLRGQGMLRELEENVYLWERKDKYDDLVGLPIDRDPADLIQYKYGENIV
ncbi:CRISPR-associated helicase, Cas3 family [Deinococcus aerius]|uniref:CRISPR-associated helicase, Cas3 family n=1 Tax=Deinococcus aerius TaxID=200253 RepID=A0A2I9DB57_9DEIO|nr:CRISPR-associated helicase/endonuclease Cas3 [Deinococcus aerius]GBF08186.1 CRISPR-associated helicase, Cas3 family [Deinococcus aerius]